MAQIERLLDRGSPCPKGRINEGRSVKTAGVVLSLLRRNSRGCLRERERAWQV